MVVFVRHTPLLGSVSLDVNDVSNAVGDKVCGELDLTLLYEPHIYQLILLHS